MQEAPTARAWRRPWVPLGLAAVLLIVAGATALATVGDLGVGSLRLVDPPAQPTAEEAEVFVELSADGDPAPGDRAFEISEEAVIAQLKADPAVSSVRAERRGDGVALITGFGDATAGEREQAVDRLRETIDGGALRARVGGEVAVQLEQREKLGEKLWRTELLAVPLALLALIAAVGSRAVAAPILCAAIAIAGALALLGLLGDVADVSLLGAGAAAVVGLVLGVELPVRALRSPVAAREQEPRPALLVAAAAAVPGFALLATPLDQAGSVAMGAAAAAVLAALAAVVVVPAVASLAEARIESSGPGRVGATSRRTLIAGGVALLALCALAVPAFVWGDTASYAALEPGLGAPTRLSGDSLIADLPLAAAIAAGVIALALTAFTRDLRALALGPLSLLPAAAALGICALLAEQTSLIGREDAAGSFLDTGAIAVALCGVAAVSCARSASAALWLSAGRRLELVPGLLGTAVGLLAAAGLYATGVQQAEDLAVAVAAGLAADLVLVRLALHWIANARLGSIR